MVSDALIEQLKRHEGFRRFPYKDTKGILTIGYGRNLVSRGISHEEGAVLLGNDVREADAQLRAALSLYGDLSIARQGVLVNMTVNMGINKLLEFKKMLTALAVGDYETAAAEMKDSAWYHDVGARAVELIQTMKTG